MAVGLHGAEQLLMQMLEKRGLYISWARVRNIVDMSQTVGRREEQGDTVGQHEGFGQIMRDHDDGPAEALP